MLLAPRQAREGQWTPVAAVRTAAVAEVIAFGIEARRVVDFALGSLSRRTFHGLAFHRRALRFLWAQGCCSN